MLNPSGARVPIHTRPLAQWPADGSVRGVLVAFTATLTADHYAASRVNGVILPTARNQRFKVC